MEHFSTSASASENVPKPKHSFFDTYFSFIESRPPSDRFIFLLFLSIFIVAIVFSLLTFNNKHKETIATNGGTLVEGVIGTPRFVNPVLAITRGDQDIASLVYSGLVRLTDEGEFTNDIADSITVSDDGLVYNIHLRQDVYFHDGIQLTSQDVAYTIALIQNPALKSPIRGNWIGVEVEMINDYEINLILEEPYTPFIENLTIGILPKHIWGELSIDQLPFSQHNTEPIGSGPYALAEVTHNKSGLIEAYALHSFPKGDQTAKISNVVLNFYQNEDELLNSFEEDKILSTAALSYDSLSQINTEKYDIIEHPLPRVFSVFLNQNKSAILREEAVRAALSVAIDREGLINEVLNGYGVPTDSPIPPMFLDVESPNASSTEQETVPLEGLRAAENLLIEAGWEQQEDRSWMKDIDDSPTKLAITITTANTEVFERTAEYIKQSWEALGVEVNVALFEQTDLVQVIIRPRDYQALLFGTDVGRGLDLYPFWHSSQKNDPGLNVSLYTNITTDALLETARTTQDMREKEEALRAFEKEVTSEYPAIFLYSPSFTYVVHKGITTAEMKRIVRPSERFAEIYKWHMNESSVWPFFADQY